MKVLTLVIFCIILALTLVVTYWAAKRTNTASEFYAAGGNLSAKENGFALAGDPALFTRALIERSEGTGCWHCLSGFALQREWLLSNARTQPFSYLLIALWNQWRPSKQP